MSRFLTLPSITRRDDEGYTNVVVDFGLHPVTDWCLHLCLLHLSLTDSLTIANPDSTVKVRIEKGGDNRAKRGWFHRKTQMLALQITDPELEYWMHWFLRYYRDGIADVDHIDVEAVSRNDPREELFLTFKVGAFQPPMSAEELRRKLNL